MTNNRKRNAPPVPGEERRIICSDPLTTRGVEELKQLNKELLSIQQMYARGALSFDDFQGAQRQASEQIGGLRSAIQRLRRITKNSGRRRRRARPGQSNGAATPLNEGDKDFQAHQGAGSTGNGATASTAQDAASGQTSSASTSETAPTIASKKKTTKKAAKKKTSTTAKSSA